MGQVSPVLRRVARGYAHWCPGCAEMHVIYTEPYPGRAGPTWSFDGNLDRPSFSPSIKTTWYGGGDGQEVVRVCHYFVTAGEIRFCGDSTHHLRGRTVPLPALPPEFCDQ